MGSKAIPIDPKDQAIKNKRLTRRNFEKENDELAMKIKEIEDELKSLNIKAPDKDLHANQKSEDSSILNAIKTRRENQFKEKRIVDAELREVNQEIQTKYDAVGKLKSNLKYKNPDRVDEVIRKLETQLQKMQMKASEERRILQEISDLKGSKAKIQDFKKLEEEVRIMKEKQKNLRDRRDENVRLINSIKQEETTARRNLDVHKHAEDMEWAVYKENLSKRDGLRKQKEQFLKNKRELAEQYRKNQPIRGEYLTRRDSQRGSAPSNDSDTKIKDLNLTHTKTVTERKKPFEDEIMHCNVLLSYLEKHELQTSSTDAKEHERTDSKNFEDTEQKSNFKDDIYYGVKRRPSKRERRKKQHFAEPAKKLEHHVTVLELFVSLSIRPPALIIEIPNAKRAIRDKKKSFKEEQVTVMQMWKIKRAKSSPFISVSKDISKETSSALSEEKSLDDAHDMIKKSKNLDLVFNRRHKSCPSLPEALEGKTDGESSLYGDLTSDKDSSQSKDFSASNSEYDLDSPRSATSSTGFSETRSYLNEEKRKSFVLDDEVDYAEPKLEDRNRQGKFQLKVHFASEVTEVSDSEINEDQISTAIKQGVDLNEKVENEPKNENSVRSALSNGLLDRADVEQSNDIDSDFGKSDKKPGGKLSEERHSLTDEQNIDMFASTISHTSKDLEEDVDSQASSIDGKWTTNDNEYDSDNESEESMDDRRFVNSNELQFPMDDLPSGSAWETAFSERTSTKILTTGSDSQRFSHQVTETLPSSSRAQGGCSPRRSQGYFDKNDDGVEVTTY